MNSVKRLGRTVVWVMGMTRMCVYHDMTLISQEGWETDEFLEFWIPTKQRELDFVGIIGGLVAAVVTACLGFPALATSHWVIPIFWFCTLIFSIGSVALAFQQKAALNGMALGKEIRSRRHKNSLPYARPTLELYTATDILAWQAPVQLLTYALGFFLIGLTIFIGEPLAAEEWGTGSKQALVVLGLSILPLILYFFSTWRIQILAGRIKDEERMILS